jgi:hypothetical protein
MRERARESVCVCVSCEEYGEERGRVGGWRERERRREKEKRRRWEGCEGVRLSPSSLFVGAQLCCDMTTSQPVHHEVKDMRQCRNSSISMHYGSSYKKRSKASPKFPIKNSPSKIQKLSKIVPFSSPNNCLVRDCPVFTRRNM